MIEEIIKRQGEHLWVEVMEDYVITAELGHLAKDQKRHKEEMREHFQKLLAWHTQSIKEILEGMRDKVNDMFSVYPDWRIYDSSEDEELISKQDTVNYLEEVIKQLSNK